MNGVTFIKGRGGVPKTLPGEDHISGLLMYIADADLPSGFATSKVLSFSTIESAETAGIVSTSLVWKVKTLHYHLSEFFRANPSGIIYVGLFTPPVAPAVHDYTELKELANAAEGKIRQIALYEPTVDLAAGELTAIKAVSDVLTAEFKPASIICGFNTSDIDDYAALASTGLGQISVVIGQDGDGVAKTLFEDETSGASVTCLGFVLGCLSLASVHESISWVDKFPAGIDKPALSNGDLINEIDNSVLEALDTKRYIFLRKHIGIAGSFFNDSHTMDLATSDYAYIEATRTIDKATRGIRTYVLPYLSSPLRLDPETGRLTQDTVSFLETLAGNALLQMERAGELSGSKVTVDPNQNVLTSSEVEFVVEMVGVGVMRKMKFKIGFTTQLS